MGKVGIMTFHRAYNCGSILQGLALQHALEHTLGFETEMIDFSNEGQRNVYSVFYKRKTPRNMAKNLLCLPGYRIIRSHYSKYEDLINAGFKLSRKKYFSEDELESAGKDYAALVCGSDQIWNVDVEDGGDAYFLSFAENVRKVAFAPSLGAVNILLSERREDYQRYLMDFHALSVREKRGKALLEELTGRRVELIIDPSLLLTKAGWEALAGEVGQVTDGLDTSKPGIDKNIPDAPDTDNNAFGIHGTNSDGTGAYRTSPDGAGVYRTSPEVVCTDGSKIPSGDFIFYYAFAYSAEVNQKIQQFAKEVDLPVVVMDAKQWFIKHLYTYGFKLTRDGGPMVFLRLIRDARYVLTTSFHGTAFSAIYGKQFSFLDSSMHRADDDRSATLVEQLGLKDRYIPLKELTKDRMNQPVDYALVHGNIERLQEIALDYLKEGLSGI